MNTHEPIHQDKLSHSWHVFIGKVRRDADGIYIIDPSGGRSISFPDVLTAQRATLKAFPDGYLLVLDPVLLQDDLPETA